MRLACIAIVFLSGCAGQNAPHKITGDQAWEKAPTLHDVPDEAQPLDKELLIQKERELIEKYHEKSVGLTVETHKPR